MYGGIKVIAIATYTGVEYDLKFTLYNRITLCAIVTYIILLYIIIIYIYI